MKFERLILIAFLGNYLVNNIVGAIVSLIPSSGAKSTYSDPHYYVYIILAAILVGLLSWWYLKPMTAANGVKNGLWFGVGGFIIAILTAFVSGLSGVILQSGSLSAAAGVLPNFGPYLANWSTLVLLGYWIVPAVVVGWYIQRGTMHKGSPMPSPVTTPSSM